MDTRTARAQLNDLAGDAGRLGITSKQQILDFVEAADQINVALGEDLGEDAVKNIGKLAQLFGDADAMGLKQAMLATGSVINESRKALPPPRVISWSLPTASRVLATKPG